MELAAQTETIQSVQSGGKKAVLLPELSRQRGRVSASWSMKPVLSSRFDFFLTVQEKVMWAKQAASLDAKQKYNVLRESYSNSEVGG